MKVTPALVALCASANMNGEYMISNPNLKSGVHYSTQLEDYGNGKGEVKSFTIYSPPIRSRYSQVYWTMQDAVPLPGADGIFVIHASRVDVDACVDVATNLFLSDIADFIDEIVKEFDGKVMAITGYEADQVIVQKGKPDMSVPITWACKLLDFDVYRQCLCEHTSQVSMCATHDSHHHHDSRDRQPPLRAPHERQEQRPRAGKSRR